MSEVNTPRLMAAAKEFNIGTNTLIDFLVSKNYSADDLKPTTKLSEDMYRVLQGEFQQDKAARQKAEQIDLPKGASGNETKKKRDEEDLSIKKKEEKAAKEKAEEKPVEVAVEDPVAVAPVIEEKPVEQPVEEKQPVKEENGITKIEAPELEALKVLDKIDLDAIDSSTRPKKSAKKKEEPISEEAAEAKVETEETPKPKKKAEPVAETVAPAAEEVKPAVAEEPATDAPPRIENIQATRLTGPKIMGKIVLPVDSDTRPKKRPGRKT